MCGAYSIKAFTVHGHDDHDVYSNVVTPYESLRLFTKSARIIQAFSGAARLKLPSQAVKIFI